MLNCTIARGKHLLRLRAQSQVGMCGEGEGTPSTAPFKCLVRDLGRLTKTVRKQRLHNQTSTFHICSADNFPFQWACQDGLPCFCNFQLVSGFPICNLFTTDFNNRMHLRLPCLPESLFKLTHHPLSVWPLKREKFHKRLRC